MRPDRAHSPRRLVSVLLLGAALVLGGSGPGTAVAAASVAPSAIEPGTVDHTSINLDATYAVDIAVRYGNGGLRMDSTATITNTSGEAIDRVELNTVVVQLGGIRLYRVTVDGRAVVASLSEQTIVVPLGGILQPGAMTTVRVIYFATLLSTVASSDWFFTRTNGVIDLYRVIPWVSLQRPFSRENHGDPFILPTSRQVTLKLTTDKPMVAALNAAQTSVSADGRVQTFVAENVRDLPIALSPDFSVTRSVLGKTEILVYTRPGGNSAALMANARRSLARTSALLGPYPWPRFVVVSSAGGYAMEGPGTIWIPRLSSTGSLPYLVAHETAHQWLYGLVGNDQWGDPFADEATADMVSRYVVNQHRASRCYDDRLDLPITSYSQECYFEIVYIQGGNWLNGLRELMGDGVYWAALRGYLDAHRFGLSDTRTMLDALDAATPIDIAFLAAPLFPSRYPPPPAPMPEPSPSPSPSPSP